MTLEEALSELDHLLSEEEQALIKVDLDAVVTLSGRKNELVLYVEQELADEKDLLSEELLELARSVHEKAHRNRFLLQHLRGCLSVVNPVASPNQTYGRDGRASAANGAGAVVRVRL